MTMLLDGIVGCWSPSLGVTGARIFDRTGFCNHGVMTNMDPPNDWIRGPIGVSVDYDGLNDYTDFGTKINLGGATVAAFSAWVWRATLGDLDVFVRYNTNLAAGTLRGDAFAINNWTTPGQVSVIVRGSAVNDYLAFYSSEVITANAWNHIAGSVFVNGNSSTCVLSLNGKRCTVNTSHSGTRPTAFAANNSVAWQSMTYVGFSGTRFYDSGRIGELAAWRTYLPVNSLCELYKRGNGWIGRELSGANRRRSRRSLGSSSRRRRLLLLGQE